MTPSVVIAPQFGAAFCEQTPGFAVAFVAVAGLFFRWDYGGQHGHGEPTLAQE